jgi:hypothetical protein
MLIDADARQDPAERAPQQAAQEDIDQQQHGQREIVEGELVVQVEELRIRLEVDVDAVRAAQRLVVEEQEEHHLRERHGDHDEVDAGVRTTKKPMTSAARPEAATAAGKVHHRLTGSPAGVRKARA